MAKSGVIGPFRGGYFTVPLAATGSFPPSAGATGATKITIGAWAAPTGMDVVVVDARAYIGTSGTNAAPRINIEAGGTTILVAGVGGAAVASGSAVALPIATTSYGTVPTTIQQPVYGAYIGSGTTLVATMSNNNAVNCGNVLVTLLCYAASHVGGI